MCVLIPLSVIYKRMATRAYAFLTFDSEPIKIQIATCGGIEFLIQVRGVRCLAVGVGVCSGVMEGFGLEGFRVGEEKGG